ncbi:MAG: hypothetical protein QOJ86_3247 [Bradyrhizobium sp.]|jgi:hypothetical protein|nr:hypothetical protein [Bradyrhizobium sp.]
MSDPRTIRELNASYTVFQKMVWGIIAAIVALVGISATVALTLHLQLGDVKTDVGAIKANTANTVEQLKGLDNRLAALDGRLASMDSRLAAIDRNLQEARADDRVLRAIGRVESQATKADPVVAGLYVTAYEATLLVQYLRPSTRINASPIITVGSQIDESRLRPIPTDVVLKSPHLNGVRYVIDDDNFKIALTGPDTNVVFAIL